MIYNSALAMTQIPKDMRPPIQVKHPCDSQKSDKGWTWICALLYRILAQTIKLTFLHQFTMLYQHRLSASKSKHIFTLIRRK